MTQQCVKCGASKDNTTLKGCSACKRVAYCGAQCQLAHWKEIHKFECKRLMTHHLIDSNQFEVTNEPAAKGRFVGKFSLTALDNPRQALIFSLELLDSLRFVMNKRERIMDVVDDMRFEGDWSVRANTENTDQIDYNNSVVVLKFDKSEICDLALQFKQQEDQTVSVDLPMPEYFKQTIPLKLE